MTDTPRAATRCDRDSATEAAEVERALRDVELLLLGLTGRWLSRTLLGGTALLASACSPPGKLRPDAASQALPLPAARDASTGAPADGEPPRTAEAREAERALLAEQLLPSARGEPLNVTTPAPGGGKPVSCREDQPLFPVRAAGLSIDDAPEYLELRSLHTAGEGRAAVDQFTVLDRLGTPCASATNDRCRSKLAGSVSEASAALCVQLCVGYSVVTTQGDEVKQWSGPAEIRQLLGDIVSENDALLLVATNGYQLVCDNPARSTVRRLKDGFEVYATRITGTCSPVESTRYRLHVSTAGEVRELDKQVVSRGWDVCIGREPVGLLPAQDVRGGSALGDFLAHCARLEEASVHAFERMAHELNEFGAPMALIARAREAARDERRHARMVTQLARTRGGRVEQARVAAPEPRSLEQVARENVVEGCVRETYGALLGAHQAAHARDVQLRAALLEIARDELRHAALSHALHAWLITQLDDAARARLRSAQTQAIAVLRAQCASAGEPAWHADAGLPSPARALQLLSELQHDLWCDA